MTTSRPFNDIFNEIALVASTCRNFTGEKEPFGNQLVPTLAEYNTAQQALERLFPLIREAANHISREKHYISNGRDYVMQNGDLTKDEKMAGKFTFEECRQAKLRLGEDFLPSEIPRSRPI